jgi:type II secretory pathway component GspD/PulD (secretin)
MEVSMNDMEELGFHYLMSRRNGNAKYMEQSKLTPATASTPDPKDTVNVYYPAAAGEKYSKYYTTWSPGDGPIKLPDGENMLYYTKAPIQKGGSQLTFGPNTYSLTRSANDIGSRSVMDGLFSAQYTDASSGFSVSGAVTAIDQADSTDVLFCPRITTTNNYAANIKMVTKKYFPTDWEEAEVGTIAGPNGDDVPLFTASIPELEENELGVILPVRPTILENRRTISIPINPVVKEHVGWVDYSYPLTVSVAENESQTFTNIVRMPIFEERNVMTTVNCDDGETIILGGVVHDTTNSIDDQYPLLGNLPLIGRLFQSKAKVSEKKNLLIFMTCRLITPDGSPVREREMRGLPPFRQ